MSLPECGRIAHRAIDGLVDREAARSRNGTPHDTSCTGRSRARSVTSSPSAAATAARSSTIGPKRRRPLRHPGEAQIAAGPLEIDRHRSDVQAEHEPSRAGRMTPVCASANVLPIVG